MPLVLRPPTEHVALPDRLGTLGRARRRAIVAAGVFRLVALTLALVALAGGLDAAIHLPGGVRAVLLVGIVSAGIITFLRGVRRPLREPVHPLGVALLLEDEFPKLNDSLASAVDFLEAGPPVGGNRFRRVAVTRAENLARRYDFDTIVPMGRMWKAFWLAALVTMIVLPLALLSVSRTGFALVRLADPFGRHPWPTRTTLELLQPHPGPDGRLMLAKGEPFVVRFVVRGVIPEQAVVSVRLASASPFNEAVPIVPAEVDAAETTVEARIDAGRVPRDFAFRIAANDTATDWMPVTVAPAPRLVPRDGRPSPQVHLSYPDYTDLPPADLPDGTGVIEGVAGTRVVFRAAADRRIIAAAFHNQTDLGPVWSATACAPLATVNPFGAVAAQLLADAFPADIPVHITGPDGTLLEADFTPHLPGLYALRFTDETGLTGVRLFDFRLFPDPAPNVALLQPEAARELLPTASIAVAARAEDRPFAVKSLFLEYRVGGADAPWRTLPLADLEAAPSAVAALAGPVAGLIRFKPVGLDGNRVLPLAFFTKPEGGAPADGDLITLRAAATDWDTRTTLKHPGRSRELEIRILSRSSLEAQFQKELAGLRPELLRVREEQHAARAKTRDVAQRATAGQPAPEDAGKLARAEEGQRQVRNKLADPSGGLRAKAEQLRQTARANNLPRSPTVEKVEAVADELGRIAEQHLEATEPLLNAARQEAQRPGPNNTPRPNAKKMADLLAQADRHQRAAEEGLTNLLERLEEWGGPGEVRGEAQSLKQQVTRAGEQADKAADKVPDGAKPDELTPTEKAELGAPADRFDQTADQAGRLVSKATRLAAEKEQQSQTLRARAAQAEQQAGAQSGAAADTLKAEAAGMRQVAERAAAEAAALRQAVRAAGGQALPDDLRRAARELRKNQTGESAAARQSASNRLDKLAEQLVERPPESPDELKKKRKDTADEINKLGQAQDELRKKTREAEAIRDPAQRAKELAKLTRQQEQLRRQAEQLVRRLTRERANPPANAVRRAAEQMDAARAELEQGRPPADQQEDALNRLDEAMRKLDTEQKQDQEQLSREKRTQLLERLKAIRDRQQAANTEAARIQETAAKAKHWDRPLIASLRDLDDREKALAEELRGFTEKQLGELIVFRKLATQSADAMERAARAADERKRDLLDADPDAFDAELEKVNAERLNRPLRTALRRLDQILDTLKEDPKAQAKANSPAGGNGGGGDGDGGGAPPGDSIPALAQLKALRAMQAEVNERTTAFAQAHPDAAKLTDDERDELKELEQSQRDVAELFDKLAEAFRPGAEVP
jgi:hypothetical protein